MNSNTPNSETESQDTKITRTIGQVKWFNSKAGYGFITSDKKDVFVHYSTIDSVSTGYKYLVLGEYVEFELINSLSDKYEYQASKVTGINGGTLMCETRQELRNSEKARPPRGPPKLANKSEDDFNKVKRKRSKSKNNDDSRKDEHDKYD